MIRVMIGGVILVSRPLSDYLAELRHKEAYHRAMTTAAKFGRRCKCSKCGLYGCVCQLGLNEFVDREGNVRDKYEGWGKG